MVELQFVLGVLLDCLLVVILMEENCLLSSAIHCGSRDRLYESMLNLLLHVRFQTLLRLIGLVLLKNSVDKIVEIAKL